MNNRPQLWLMLAAIVLFALACDEEKTNESNDLGTTPEIGNNSGTPDIEADTNDADDQEPDAPDMTSDVEPQDLGTPDMAPDIEEDAGEPDANPDPPDLVEPVPPEINPDDFDQAQAIDFIPDEIPAEDNIFSLGVSSGAMTDSGALFWGYASDAAPATLRIWRASDTPGQVLEVYNQEITPTDGGYFKIQTEGLAPWTWYNFGFFRQDDAGTPIMRSRLGRVRTALPEGALYPVTVGATACTNQSRRPFVSLSDMAQEDIDVFISVGATTYNDSATNLSGYRAKWAENLTDPGYRDILPHTGSYWTWDDHEVTNNWIPALINPARLAAAKQAYFETLPNERGPNDRLWRSYKWGDSVEFFILDSRSERRPMEGEQPPKYISPEQMQWLKDSLSASTAHFKVLLNSVPITQMPIVWPGFEDRWQGYVPQREELLNYITDNDVEHVWFLTGDFHVGFISHVEPEGPRRRIRELAVGPGGSNGNPIPGLADVGLLAPEEVYPIRQFDYGTGYTSVTTTLRFDPVNNLVRARYVNAQNGDVLFDEWIGED